jgi:spore coat protein CotH
VRLKGQLGSKRAFNEKPAFKIDVEKGQDVLGFDNLTLNNMVQDSTMLHETLGYRVYADAGVPVPETTYIWLTVNGEPYGLYLLVESIDRRFLKRRFGDGSGMLYEGAYGSDLNPGDEDKFELDEGKDPGRAGLRRLIRAVAAQSDDVFYGDSALVDTRAFLAMMAVQVLINDWDNYYRSNNYRIYWNPSAHRWVFIPTGIDQTFTHHKTEIFGATGTLFRRCMKSDRCTRDYKAAVRDAAARFERLDLTGTLDRVWSVIGGRAESDPRKPYNAEAMNAARAQLRQFIETRAEEVRSDLLMTAPSSRPR